MIGRFKKAPLTIVSLKLHTSELPGFKPGQLDGLRQRMVKRDLIHHESAEVQKIQFPFQDGQLPTATGAKFNRYGFFNSERTESFFMDDDSFEWRMTDYVDFSSFKARVLEIYEDLVAEADFLVYLQLNAVVLTYSDLIVPFPGRRLSDYFLTKEFVPLEIKLPSEGGQFTFGMNQLTRIVDEETRLTLSMEQLPLSEGKALKVVHDSMVETHPNFTNRIEPMSHWKNSNAESYGVMLMQGIWAKPMKISNSSWDQALVNLNGILSIQFESLLDRSVCDVDWEHVDD